MKTPSEETLMAYADGALRTSARDALSHYLSRNGEAAAIVLMYRQTAILLKQAFEQPMWEPVVDRIPDAPPVGWWRRSLVWKRRNRPECSADTDMTSRNREGRKWSHESAD